MPQPKTFDRADLVRFFYDHGRDAEVGRFTVIKPSPTLFGQTENLRYPVEAQTTAYWCERYALCIVVQAVCFPDGGASYFGSDHALRQGRRVTVRNGDGGSSAELVRWVMELADEWRDEVSERVPVAAIDLRAHVPGTETAESSEGDNAAPAEPSAETPAADPDATIDDDHTPTGTSIDDVLNDDDGGATKP